MCLERNVTLRVISNIDVIQRSIPKWILNSSRSTRMNRCCSILRLRSFMLFLPCLVNLRHIYTVSVSWHNLVVVVIVAMAATHVLGIEPCELLAHATTFLSVILALTTLGEVYDVVASFWTTGGVSAVFERYLVLSNVDSTTSTDIGLSSSSLTAQLILIMKACIGQSIERASILFEVLGLRHQWLRSWISS